MVYGFRGMAAWLLLTTGFVVFDEIASWYSAIKNNLKKLQAEEAGGAMKDFVRMAAGSLIGGIVFFTFTVLAFGQAQTGTLRGVVSDPNGGVVAGATVTAKNQATGVASA